MQDLTGFEDGGEWEAASITGGTTTVLSEHDGVSISGSAAFPTGHLAVPRLDEAASDSDVTRFDLMTSHA